MTTPSRNAKEAIEEAVREGLTHLSLAGMLSKDESDLDLDEKTTLGLACLEHLDLSSNALVRLPPMISSLKRLHSLNVSGNKLSSLPKEVGALKNLRNLNVASNPMSSLPAELVDLPLWHLNAEACPLEDLSPILALTNLRSLVLSRQNLNTLPSGFSALRLLTQLDLQSNRFEVLPSVLWSLSTLESLNLGDNPLGVLPADIKQLHRLRYLHLYRARLTSLPTELATLKRIELLALWNNRLTEIPSVVYRMTSLKELSFRNDSTTNTKRDNNTIRLVPKRILKLTLLETLELKDNPLESPPPEIAYKGIGAVRDYYRQLSLAGEDFLYEAKLLLVGEGGAGKTSLAHKIVNPDYVLMPDEVSTEGIEVTKWQFQLPNGRLCRVNIWDFGGQEIYHSTHQFFLTQRSVYVLVADTRKEDTDFAYWLNIIELLGGNSPLLIINNEKQDRHREIDERQLRGEFVNLRETIATNLADNRGLPAVTAAIEHYVSSLPHIGTPLPKTWVTVRAALEFDIRNYIAFEEYSRLCEGEGFSDPKEICQLSGYLHDLGICLHFQHDPLLKRFVILKPKWGTDAVYRVLDTQAVIRNQGRFTRADLDTIWNDSQYANMRDELLQLMSNFKLCYQIPGSEMFIAPQLLSERQPFYDWNAEDNLRLRFRYEFMPKGIVTRMIVALHSSIANGDLVWKNGVVLERDGTQAEVIEYYSRREIRVRFRGEHKREFAAILLYELDRIHVSFRRIKCTKLIPCNCSVCSKSETPHFYSLEVLEKFVKDKQKSIQCQVSYEMVFVPALLAGVFTVGAVGQEERTIVVEGDFNTVIVNPASQGRENMKPDNVPGGRVTSAWANGSFYLFLFATVITGFGVLSHSISWQALIIVLIAGLLFVPLIGVLQLMQDHRISEKGFIEVVKLVLKQLPIIGKIASRVEK